MSFSNSLTIYLDGATPTKFGPRPRKSDLGPSFSRIDLKIKTNRGKKWVVFGLKVILLVLAGGQKNCAKEISISCEPVSSQATQQT